MEVLVTGGAGYLGRHLARALVEGGRTVTVLDDLSCPNSRMDVPELDHPKIRCIEGSTLDAGLVTGLVTSHPVVVHFASVVGVEETIRKPWDTIRNLEGTTNLLSHVTRDHVTLFGSSADVYGMHSRIHDREMREDDSVLFEHAAVERWVYPKVKALEEVLFANSAARNVSIRFFNCYGPGMDQPFPKRVIPQFVGQVLRREPLRVSCDGRQTRTMCYVHDLVAGVVAALKHVESRTGPYTETINLGGTETYTVLELAHRVVEAAQQVGLIHEPLRIETQAELYSRPFDDGWNRVPNLDRARSLLGYRPTTPLAEGLRRTLEIHLDSSIAGPSRLAS